MTCASEDLRRQEQITFGTTPGPIKPPAYESNTHKIASAKDLLSRQRSWRQEKLTSSDQGGKLRGGID
jgi:hypothetical protein